MRNRKTSLRAKPSSEDLQAVMGVEECAKYDINSLNLCLESNQLSIKGKDSNLKNPVLKMNENHKR